MRFFTGALKIGLSLAIIAYLVWDTAHAKGHDNVFAALAEQPKDWGLLTGAWLVLLVATLLTMVRWWWLLRALDVPCRLNDAVRIGFWGYLFNLAPLGIVSGDVVKAYLLAREQRQHRARVVASILVDRVIGVYLLFVFATAAILLTGFAANAAGTVVLLCRFVYLVTAVGAVGIAVVIISGVTGGRGLRMLARIPRLGPPLKTLIEAIRLYRHRPIALCASAGISLLTHGLSATGCYLVARSLPGDVVSLANHFIVIPLSIAASMVPLPLGPFEFAIEFLYTHLPQGAVAAKGQGLIVALVVRLMGILISVLGVLCYFGRRRELAGLSEGMAVSTASVENGPIRSDAASPAYTHKPTDCNPWA